jgi:hypothetical protein
MLGFKCDTKSKSYLFFLWTVSIVIFLFFAYNIGVLIGKCLYYLTS